MLRQVARKPDQLAREREQARDERVRRVEARVPDPRVLDLAAVPPLHRVRETVDLGRVEPQCLADVAHRALRPVADHGRRKRSAGAPVLRVEVLDHLLAPLVLEVHVDVGRLVALARDESLEQHGHARRVHLGDAERVAGGGVRRRAPPLAQDAAGAGELDEVVHRQEIGLVAELCDQRELALDELPDRRWHPCRPAPHRTLFDQAAQVKLGRRACRHDLLRVFVAKLVEREPAALGNLACRVEERLRIQRRDPRERAEHSFAVRVKRIAGPRDRRLQSHGGQHVLHRAPPALVHVHVAGRDRGERKLAGERRQAPEPLAVGARGRELHREPEAAGETLAQPLAFCCRRLGTRQPQDETVFETLPDVVARDPILPFRRGPAAPCNESGECRVPAAARGEADEFQAVRQRELAADDERKVSLARSGMRPHDSRERAFVRQCERAIAEFFCARDQLCRMRRAAQEREVADAVQFRVHRASRPRDPQRVTPPLVARGTSPLAGPAPERRACGGRVLASEA